MPRDFFNYSNQIIIFREVCAEKGIEKVSDIYVEKTRTYCPLIFEFALVTARRLCETVVSIIHHNRNESCNTMDDDGDHRTSIR